MNTTGIMTTHGKLTLVAATIFALAVPMSAVGQYAVETKWTVGGAGGWDYLAVDPSAPRLVPDARESRRGAGHRKLARWWAASPGCKGRMASSSIRTGRRAISPMEGPMRLWSSTGRPLRRRDRSRPGTNPDGMVFEPKTKTVWAFNGRSNNVSVLDGAAKTTVATIPLPGKPEFPTADGTGSVFVNIEDKNVIVKLDAVSKKAVATWPLAGCESPSGMAIDMSKDTGCFRSAMGSG